MFSSLKEIVTSIIAGVIITIFANWYNRRDK